MAPTCSPNCAPTSPCGANGDCYSGVCTNGLCLPAPNTHACVLSTDCASGSCVAGHCAAPACSPTCGTASPCGANGDCVSGTCTNALCQAESCSPTCVLGHACGSNLDCASGACAAAVCVAAAAGTCTANPCDPYCQDFSGTPAGITTPPAGLVVTGGTLTLSGTGGATACTGLTVTPATATITVTSLSPFTTTPTSATFAAACTTGTPAPTWSLSNTAGTAATIGTISTAGVVTIYSPISGPLTVTATNGALTATATVNVVVNINDTNGATPGLVTDLTGAGTVVDTAVPLYPYSNTLFPVYLPAPLLQWDIGTGTTLATGVKVALDSSTNNFHWSQIYTGEPEQGITSSASSNVPGPYHHVPAYKIPQNIWSAFELSAAPATPIVPGTTAVAQISFQRYVGTTLYEPVAIPVNFSLATPLNGTVYYVEYERNITNAHANDGSVTNVSFPYTIGTSICPVGNGTHLGGGGSGTRSLSVVGAAAAPADPFNGNGPCAVCHSLSANGKTYVGVQQYWTTSQGGTATIGVNSIGAGGTFTAVTQALPTANDGQRGFSYGAVTPDGKYVLQGSEFWGNTAAEGPSANATTAPDSPATNYTGYNITGSPATTVTLSGLPAGRLMMAPQFSPDGTKLVYVNGDTGVGGTTGWRKGLSMFSVAETSASVLTFSAEKLLFNTWNAGGTGNPVKWPFFEPDSQSIVFMETTPSAYCSSANVGSATNVGCYNNPYGGMEPTSRGEWPGTLYSLNTAGTLPATPVALTNLNKGIPQASGADDDLSYQPTVLSVVAAGYRWVIFTSPRAYGNQLNNYSIAAAKKTDPSCATSQLWMAAIENVASGTTDRSFPAFWLPSQLYEPIVSGAGSNQYVNERGYLVPSACKVTGTTSASLCNVNSDCCSSTCRIDLPAASPPTLHCQPAPGACSAIGGSCAVTTDCCGTGTEVCTSGSCVGVTNYMSSSFSKQFTASCPAGTGVIWENFEWNASSPMPAAMVTSANIVFTATAAATVAGLATSPTATLATANYANSNAPVGTPITNYEYANVASAFASAGSSATASQAVLQITMTFNPSSDDLQSPTLYDWDQQYDCAPNQ